jgi:hypothetical protein
MAHRDFADVVPVPVPLASTVRTVFSPRLPHVGGSGRAGGEAPSTRRECAKTTRAFALRQLRRMGEELHSGY